MSFFEPSKGAQSSFEFHLSHQAADVIEWTPAMKSFHRASTATSTAPSSKSNRDSTLAMARSAHSGLDLHSLVTTGALQSAVTVESFQLSRFPLRFATLLPLGTPGLQGLTAYLGIGPAVGVGLLPLCITSNYEFLMGLSAGNALQTNVRLFIECVTLQSVEVGTRIGKVRNFFAVDTAQVSNSFLVEVFRGSDRPEVQQKRDSVAAVTPKAASDGVGERRPPMQPLPSTAAPKQATAAPLKQQPATAKPSAAAAVVPEYREPPSTESAKAEAAVFHPTLRTGLGVIVKRDLASGINLWWGAAADLSPSTHFATHVDVLRRWTVSLNAHFPEWRMRLAARLRMNVITYRSTVIDTGVAYEVSDRITLRASSSTAGVAVGLTATDGVREVLLPITSRFGSRVEAAGRSLAEVADALLGRVDVTAGVLSRYPHKPVLSGFLVLHGS